MAISQKDIKLLWGRSGNRCAKCRTNLSFDKNTVNASFTLGEQAHIVGEKEGAARGYSLLTLDERNSYHNLILLCPNCHTEIDENEQDWPIEKIHKLKSEHELWVSEALSETIDHVKLAKDVAIGAIVDSTVSLGGLENWKKWTKSALAVSPSWAEEQVDNSYILRQRMIGAIWPNELDEFHRATVTFATLLHKASEKFLEHADLSNKNRWHAIKFYKLQNPNPNYDADLEQYESWLAEYYELVHLSTKAANWFADVVRRDINPFFFLENGRFLIEEGLSEDFSVQTRVLQFSAEEKQKLLNGISVP